MRSGSFFCVSVGSRSIAPPINKRDIIARWREFEKIKANYCIELRPRRTRGFCAAPAGACYLIEPFLGLTSLGYRYDGPSALRRSKIGDFARITQSRKGNLIRLPL